MKHSSWLALVGILALAVGCGSDDSSGGGGGTGASSSGGSAGSDTGGTASGGAASGGDSSGGEAGAGEAGAGQGGAGADECPTETPSQGEDCEGLEGEVCAYEDSGCWCPAQGPNSGTWQCAANDMNQCEDDEPATGECMGGSFCSHSEGSGLCFCPPGGPSSGMWSCSGG